MSEPPIMHRVLSGDGRPTALAACGRTVVATMPERLSPGGVPQDQEIGVQERWRQVSPYRERLLRFAQTFGAGPDAEDIVHEALIAAAGYDDLDERRVWELLANITARRIADRYRRAARVQILVRHRALVPRPRSFEHEVVDRAEAVWVAEQLIKLLPPEIMDILWRHHVGGATWEELAASRAATADALKQRVSRALLNARRHIGIAASD